MPKTSMSKLRDELLAEDRKLAENGKVSEVEEEEVSTKNTKKQNAKKTFKDTDLIRCVSVTVGKLIMIGQKSEDKYVWDGMNDATEVEYRDLMAAIRKHSALVYKPRFIIEDKEFLAQNPEIEELYGSLYTPEDIDKILNLPADRMKEYIEQMPQGAKDALLGIAIQKIDRGQLDSIQRIKVIDDIFGTQMLLKVAQ